MKKSIMKNKQGFLRRLLLCLCAALLICSAACAQTIVELGVDGWDSLGYDVTLPDGRMIFSGCVGEVGNYMNSKARLLCLNPDGTTSWEYLYPQEGSCSFSCAALMKDGTLAVYFEDAPHQETKEKKIVFFTMDGLPTGKETELQLEDSAGKIIIGHILTASGYMEQYMDAYGPADSDGYCTSFSDWDGNLLFQLDDQQPILDISLIEEEDGLVMIGREPGSLMNAAGTITKIDFQGNTVWETTVPFLNEVNEGVTMSGIKTSDGCYLAVLLERGLNAGSPDSIFTYALVKFSSTGRILWTNQESFDKRPEGGFSQVVEYNGKYVVCNNYNALDYPIHYLWFDADGNELGVTEIQLRKKDLPRLGNKKKVEGFPGRMISTEAGLWQEYVCWCEASTHEKELASQDDVLIKIPEL